MFVLKNCNTRCGFSYVLIAQFILFSFGLNCAVPSILQNFCIIFWLPFIYLCGIFIVDLFFFKRVVLIFGERVKEQVIDVTPTFLSQRVLATLRSADTIANRVLLDSGQKLKCLII